MGYYQIYLIISILGLLSIHALESEDVLKAFPATPDDALGAGGYLIELVDPQQAEAELRYGNGQYPGGNGGRDPGGNGGWYPSGDGGRYPGQGRYPGYRPPYGGGGEVGRYPCGRGRPCYRVMQEPGGPNNEVNLWYNDQ